MLLRKMEMNHSREYWYMGSCWPGPWYRRRGSASALPLGCTSCGWRRCPSLSALRTPLWPEAWSVQVTWSRSNHITHGSWERGIHETQMFHLSYTHARTHARTHACTHARTHTHTHTHTDQHAIGVQHWQPPPHVIHTQHLDTWICQHRPHTQQAHEQTHMHKGGRYWIDSIPNNFTAIPWYTEYRLIRLLNWLHLSLGQNKLIKCRNDYQQGILDKTVLSHSQDRKRDCGQ